ncbi:MAG: haloacid dehalogenase [Candidatus Altiarchaeales archaeon ex4484_2]|nr:MAG: haloacid dehalogenase [Candidatus Altiarchaeales archaeon ex4484_2]
MREIKAVLFDVDDTLYDSTLQVNRARANAVKAMREAGLGVTDNEGLLVLEEIVKEFGSNYPNQFNELLKKLEYEYNPRIIAAGVAAYHSTKTAYLTPFPDTVPTLLKLRDSGFMLGVVTDGISVKQWEKLIRLGLQHFFHTVVISSDVGCEKPREELFHIAAERLSCKKEDMVMVGDRIDRDILGANKAGMLTVRIMKGKYRNQKPENSLEKPDYIIENLHEIIEILKK